MCKDVQEEKSENVGDGDNFERNKLNKEYEERRSKNLKTRSSRERKEPIGGEIEERELRHKENGSSRESDMYERQSSRAKTRKHKDKSHKAHHRSISNEGDTFRTGDKGYRNSREYSDDDM